MNIFKYIIRFLLILLTQAFLLNQIEIGYGIHLMIYPLFILLLPIRMPIILMMLLSFLLGFSIDIFSDTFGLHASSSIFLAAIRNYWYNKIETNDELDEIEEVNVNQFGFFKVFLLQGILVLFHHLWFFTLEMFKWTEFILILQKTIYSFLCSFTLIFIIQKIFLKKNDN